MTAQQPKVNHENMPAPAFVTEPIDRVGRCVATCGDPDGYLIEVGQATGMLEGRCAKKRPEDLPG